MLNKSFMYEVNVSTFFISVVHNDVHYNTPLWHMCCTHVHYLTDLVFPYHNVKLNLNVLCMSIHNIEYEYITS